MASSDVEFVVVGAEDGEDDDCGSEKQISVDPVSLKQAPRVLPPFVKPKVVSTSLPCSANSSPEFSPSLPKSLKKWSNPAQLPHPAFHPSLARQHSIAQPKHPQQQQQQGMLLPRSKSCGDGRSSQPPDEFDILSRRLKNITVQPQAGVLTSESSSKLQEEIHAPEEEFKCGALCLFLPGFAKKKQEQAQLRRQDRPQVKEEEEDSNEAEEEEEEEEKDARDEEKEENTSVASRVASLERFECASWSSATILDDIDDDCEGGINAYFDLPLELIRGSTDDTLSPVKTAFVFDRERKGVLKKSTSKSGPRKSCESSNRHVRFSTSTPVSFPASPNSGCLTPRLFQAREEFNAALLEAHNAYINF